ncbi:prepilin-type N-terminal cleavage/methylation domain-containing protein [bacterium]|nr:MAG: prepilin-type N-terminal cleavage/methylation domain-containing protein [bacterium]
MLVDENLKTNQRGQTLIETMVAALVLTMGISAAVGLAVYGLNATSGISKQLQATGLAREGMEAVKNMRDTNWLRTSLSTNCFDFYTQTDAGNCYQGWLNGAGGGYSIFPGGAISRTYRLGFNANSNNEHSYWELTQTNSGYGLDYDTSNLATGFFKPSADSTGDSGFSRKITLTTEDFPPFDQSTGPRVRVRVDVWWTDKRCPASADVPTSNSCLITLETYLTNWKNY